MKKDLYQALVKKRQSKAYEGYNNIAEYHDGFYECDHVSPYSLGADNLEADIMYFLQDWAGHEWMCGPVNEDSAKYGCSPKFPTNRNLEKWLSTYFGVEKKNTFGTNVFPFIKGGKMSAGLKAKDIKKAAVDFGLPMIKIVQPKVVVAFGLSTYNGLRTAAGLKAVSKLEEAIDKPFEVDGVPVHCLAHPGQLGTNSRNRLNKGQVEEDWKKVALHLK